MDNTGFWYNFVFAVLIILFTYFYTAITINPTQMSDDLKRNNGFIPGVKPGKSTKDYLDTIMDRIICREHFPCSSGYHACFCPDCRCKYGVLAVLWRNIFVDPGWCGVDTLQQVESHLLMRHYDGLLKSGRIKGRSGAVGAY